MKKVIDTDGNEIEVEDSTIVKTIDGVNYVLNAEELEEYNTNILLAEANKIQKQALEEILMLESEIKPRRYREAILGTDNGWLANQEALIAIERNKLGGN